MFTMARILFHPNVQNEVFFPREKKVLREIRLFYILYQQFSNGSSRSFILLLNG